MLVWRGWGISVLLVFFFWVVVMMVAGKDAAGLVVPHGLSSDMSVQWLFGITCGLDAVSVFFLARYRKSHPLIVTDPGTNDTERVARVDHFAYIPFAWWTYILLAGGALLMGASVFGVSLLGG